MIVENLNSSEIFRKRKKQAVPRVIIIVGANRGIGYYIVKYLLEHGDFISALDIETDNLEKLRDKYDANRKRCQLKEMVFRMKYLM